MTRPFTLLLSLGMLGALTACGGERSASTTAPDDVSLEVRALDGLVWDAKSYSATAVDGTITVFTVNDSSLPHNLHVFDANGADAGRPIDLPTRGSSGTAEFSVVPGEYRIVCTIPGHTAMDVPLIVT